MIQKNLKYSTQLNFENLITLIFLLLNFKFLSTTRLNFHKPTLIYSMLQKVAKENSIREKTFLSTSN